MNKEEYKRYAKQVVVKAMNSLERTKNIKLRLGQFYFIPTDEGCTVIFRVIFPTDNPLGTKSPLFELNQNWFEDPYHEMGYSERLLGLMSKTKWDLLAKQLSAEDFLVVLLAGWIYIAGKEKKLI